MKIKKITIASFLFVSICSINMAYSQLTNGLKAYYSFGGNTNDISGNNHNGTISNGVSLTSDRFGTANCAYSFNGSPASYIDIPNAADFNIGTTGAMTISLWYQGGDSDISNLEGLFEKNPLGISLKYNLALYDMNILVFGFNFSTISPPIPDLNWHHAVAVYDNQKWYLYSDNITVAYDLSQSNSIDQNSSDIFIGRGFTGKIDDIRFYNRALTNNEIDQLYNFGGSCASSGLNEIKLNSFVDVFPNPSSSVFKIDSKNATIQTVHVFDLNGREIYQKTVNGLKSEINLSNYPNGVYFLKIVGDNFVENSLIEKQD